MSSHPSDADLVEYQDGTMAPHLDLAIEAHLAECQDCHQRLDGLRRFDQFVHCHQPVEATSLASMFEVSRRLLQAGPPQRRPSVWRVAAGLAAAAALLLSVGLWWSQVGSAGPGLGFTIQRYTPPDAVRSAPPERFHLDAVLAAPAFVVVLARLPSGEVVVLLPDGTPGRSPAGSVRLPPSELLDWEYPGDQLPRELLVVLCPTAPAAALLGELRAAWAEAPERTVPALLQADGRRAECLPFPGR
ncbi:MAG: zf-HC2 domain-containing protein [Planctomycetes bacterium]|nr:zf-HC2 domain-containing protein [Planctomycetota bacterium]